MENIGIVNIVGVTNLGKDVDLSLLSEWVEMKHSELWDVKYNKNKFPGLILRQKKQRSVGFTIYTNGQIIFYGAKNFESIEHDITILKNLFSEIDPTIFINPYVTTNIVAIINMGKLISLERLSYTLPMEFVEYEPEQFPGLIFRFEDSVFLIFSSGKIVCTGASDTEIYEKRYKEFTKILADIL